MDHAYFLYFTLYLSKVRKTKTPLLDFNPIYIYTYITYRTFYRRALTSETKILARCYWDFCSPEIKSGKAAALSRTQGFGALARAQLAEAQARGPGALAMSPPPRWSLVRQEWLRVRVSRVVLLPRVYGRAGCLGVCLVG